MTGLSESAVRENIVRLTEAGLLRSERRHRTDGSRTSNRYYLAVDGPFPPDDLAPESGAGPSAGNDGAYRRNPGGLAPESGGPNGNVSSTREIEPIAQPRAREAEIDAAFERIWSQWPRKVDKKAARTAFGRAVRRAPIPTIGNAALISCRVWADWTQPDREQFVPYLATWLNKSRWESDPPTPRSAGRDSVVDAGRAVHERLLASQDRQPSADRREIGTT